MIEILFILLPFAFYSGWKASRKKYKNTQQKQRELSGHFVKGVNYLLSEEPDKALEVFLNYPDIDEYTAETYQLLGNLFRNRGEVDRALRVHQNLLARPNIKQKQKHKAMFSLGQDFFAAGMLDRAESVFQELLSDNNLSKNIPKKAICTSLRTIYEQTQEWQKAIETTSCFNRLLNTNITTNVAAKNTNDKSLIAHYYCELADEALQRGALHEVDSFMKKAKKAHKKSTRLMCLAGDIAFHQKNYQKALDNYLTTIQQDSRLLSKLFEKIKDAAKEVNSLHTLQEILFDLYGKNKNSTIFEHILKLAVKNNNSPPKLSQLIKDELLTGNISVESIKNASEYLKQNQLDIHSNESLTLINKSLKNYLQNVPPFRCIHCGYKMHDFLWRCPACHHWDTIDHT